MDVMNEWKRYEQILQANERGSVSNFNTLIKMSNLESFHNAYRLTQRYLFGDGPKMGNSRDEHILCLASNYSPTTSSWKHLNTDDQYSMFKIHIHNLRLQDESNILKQKAYNIANDIFNHLPEHMRTKLPPFPELKTKITLSDLNKIDLNNDAIMTLLYSHDLDNDAETLVNMLFEKRTRANCDNLIFEKKPQNNSKESSNTGKKSSQQTEKTKQALHDLDSFVQNKQDSETNKIWVEICKQNAHLEKVKSEQEARSVAKGISNGFAAMSEIGRMTKNKDMVNAGLVGAQVVSMTMAVGQLNGFFGMAAVQGLACIEPCSAIALGAITLVSILFFSDNESDGLSEMVAGLYEALSSYFGQSFRNQKMIYDVVVENLRYMIEDFKYPVMDKLSRTEYQIQSMQQLLSTQITNVTTQSLRDLITKLSEPDLLSKNKFLLCLNLLAQWVEVESAQPSLNGAVFSDCRLQIIGQRVPFEDMIFNYLGTLVSKIQLFIEEKFYPVNLNIWQLSASLLINHLNNSHVDDSRREKLEKKIVSSISSTQDFLHMLRSSKKLYENIFASYQKLIGEIQHFVNFNSYNKDDKEPIDKKISELIPVDTGKYVGLNALLDQLDEFNYIFKLIIIILDNQNVTDTLKVLPARNSIMSTRHQVSCKFIHTNSNYHVNRGWYSSGHCMSYRNIFHDGRLYAHSNFSCLYLDDYSAYWTDKSFYTNEVEYKTCRIANYLEKQLLMVMFTQGCIHYVIFKTDTKKYASVNPIKVGGVQPIDKVSYDTFQIHQTYELNVGYLVDNYYYIYQIQYLSSNRISAQYVVPIKTGVKCIDFQVKDKVYHVTYITGNELISYNVNQEKTTILTTDEIKDINWLKTVKLNVNTQTYIVKIGYNAAKSQLRLFGLNVEQDKWSDLASLDQKEIEIETLQVITKKIKLRDMIVIAFRSTDFCVIRVYDPLYNMWSIIPNNIDWRQGTIFYNASWATFTPQIFGSTFKITDSLNNNLIVTYWTPAGLHRYDIEMNIFTINLYPMEQTFMSCFDNGYESELKIQSGLVGNVIYSTLLQIPSYAQNILL